MAKHSSFAKKQTIKIGVTTDPLINRVKQINRKGLRYSNTFRYYKIFRCRSANFACALAQRISSEAAFRSRLQLKSNNSETDYIRNTSLKQVDTWLTMVRSGRSGRHFQNQDIEAIRLRAISPRKLREILGTPKNGRMKLSRYVLKGPKHP